MKTLKGSLEGKSMFAQLLVFLAVMLLSAGICLSAFVWLFGGSMSQTATLMAMQVVQTIAVFLVPCSLSAYLFSSSPMRYLSADKAPNWKSSVAVVVTMLLLQPAINLLGHLNEQIGLPESLSGLEQMLKQMEEQAQLLIERFMQAQGVGGFLLNIVVIALLPAIAEELCFRGSLQRIFSANGRQVAAIWVCAILFSAVHFQFYGFLPRMLMGAFFGYLLVWSDSLWLPVLAHFTNNATVVVLYYIFSARQMSTDVLDTLGTGETLWMGIVSMLLVVPAVWLCRRLALAATSGKSGSRQ